MLSRRQSSRNFMLIDTPDRNSCDVYRRCPPDSGVAPFMEFDFTVGLSDSYPEWSGLWWESREGENLYVAGSATPPLAAPLFYVEIGSYDGEPFVTLAAAPGSLPTTGDETLAATITITQAGVVVVEITLYGVSDGSYLTTFDTVPDYFFDLGLTYHATLVALP